VQVDLPSSMDGKTFRQTIDRTREDIQSPILACIPRMSGAGIPVALQNQVQGRRRLNIEGERVAEPFPIGKASRIKVEWRTNDEKIIDIGAIGAAIAQPPMNADGSRLTSHEKIDPIHGILIAVGIAQPSLSTVRLDIDEGFQREPGKADRAQACKVEFRGAILQADTDLSKARLVIVAELTSPATICLTSASVVTPGIATPSSRLSRMP